MHREGWGLLLDVDGSFVYVEVASLQDMQPWSNDMQCPPPCLDDLTDRCRGGRARRHHRLCLSGFLATSYWTRRLHGEEF